MWLAMISSQVMMVVLSITQSPFQIDEIKNDLLETPQTQFFLGTATLNFILAWVLPRIILKTSQKNYDPNLGEKTLLKTCLVPFLVRLAMAESVTLLGFVLSSQVKNAAILLPFVAAAMLIMFLTYPSGLLFRSWVKK